MANDSLTMKVRAALQKVLAPESGRNIVALGMVRDLSATNAGVVRFTLDAGESAPETAQTLLEEARKAAASVEGVARVAAFGSAHRASAPAPGGGHDNPMGLPRRSAGGEAPLLPDVRHVIAVASGKGGVGKSTIAANLAAAFAAQGRKTGLLDADIYGPSLPTLFGLSGRPAMREGKIAPVEKFGVKAMSIGLLVEPQKALAWRGPMVMGATRQLMRDVDWGALDILVIDTPPGTGDVHLTLAQSKRVTGAVIVSTPQEMALADMRRGVELFRTVNVPVLGVIENMAWLEQDGRKLHLFGEGGAERAAREMEAPFLGHVPIFPELREASDAGAPLIETQPESPGARALARIAAAILDKLD